MAHNLATPNGQTAMMFTGEPPWHGLGTRLDKPATAAEAIWAAQLDWEVTRTPLFITSGSRLHEVRDKFAVVRKDQLASGVAPPVLGIVGREYTPLQNNLGWGHK